MIEWWGPVLIEYYAATEAGIVTLIDAADGWRGRAVSAGRCPTGDPLVDADGGALPAGREGRVFVRRRGSVLTYDDRGYVDGDGYLFITGRADDAILSGGVNVDPTEVRDVLLEHPAVRDAVVLGVADPEFGQRVAAIIEVAEPDRGGDLPALLDRHCRQRLAGFKVPRAYRLTAALPRDPSGKIRRRALDDAFASPG